MHIADYITVDPRICHGKPCFKDTRIMVYLVLEMLADGETPKKIMEAYLMLAKEAVGAAMFWRGLDKILWSAILVLFIRRCHIQQTDGTKNDISRKGGVVFYSYTHRIKDAEVMGG